MKTPSCDRTAPWPAATSTAMGHPAAPAAEDRGGCTELAKLAHFTVPDEQQGGHRLAFTLLIHGIHVGILSLSSHIVQAFSMGTLTDVSALRAKPELRSAKPDATCAEQATSDVHGASTCSPAILMHAHDTRSCMPSAAARQRTLVVGTPSPSLRYAIAFLEHRNLARRAAPRSATSDAGDHPARKQLMHRL